MLLIGLALLLPGLLVLAHTLNFLVRGQRATASFDGAIERNTSYGLMYYPRFVFRTADGQQISFTSGIGSSAQEYAPGSTRAIVYDPAHPERARLDGFLGMWLIPLLTLSPGLLITLIGMGLLSLRAGR